MSNNNFLNNFLQFAHNVLDAERGIAFDTALTFIETVNTSEDDIAKDRFAGSLQTAVQNAINNNEVVITNNMITDPQDAPTTNLHLHQLRMIVAIPMQSHGAIYLDRRIRNGVFQSEVVESVCEFAEQLLSEDKTDLSPSELNELFNS